MSSITNDATIKYHIVTVVLCYLLIVYYNMIRANKLLSREVPTLIINSTCQYFNILRGMINCTLNRKCVFKKFIDKTYVSSHKGIRRLLCDQKTR